MIRFCVSTAAFNGGQQTSLHNSTSLADELAGATGSSTPHLILRKCHPRFRHEDSSPDSERMATDSGHSTAHSPDNGPKSVSPIPCNTLQNTESVSPSSTPGKKILYSCQWIEIN